MLQIHVLFSWPPCTDCKNMAKNYLMICITVHNWWILLKVMQPYPIISPPPQKKNGMKSYIFATSQIEASYFWLENEWNGQNRVLIAVETSNMISFSYSELLTLFFFLIHNLIPVYKSDNCLFVFFRISRSTRRQQVLTASSHHHPINQSQVTLQTLTLHPL